MPDLPGIFTANMLVLTQERACALLRPQAYNVAMRCRVANKSAKLFCTSTTLSAGHTESHHDSVSILLGLNGSPSH